MSSSPFFSLRNILAEEERVPVTWETDARGVAVLDPSASSGGADIKHDSEMDIPLWLATSLKGQNFVSVRLPRTYSVRAREKLRADPVNAPLRATSPHFYELGLRLGELVDSEETRTLPNDMQSTLAQRVQSVLDRAPRGLGRDTSAYKGGLTDIEERLYSDVQYYAALRQRHREGKDQRIEALSETTTAKVIASAQGPRSKNQKRDRSLLG